MQVGVNAASREAALSAAVAQIEYLIKESEVLTGKPGRTFVIEGSERLAYRVYWQNQAFKVERFNDDKVVDTQYLLPKAFASHGIPEALRAGRLITAAARAPQ